MNVNLTPPPELVVEHLCEQIKELHRKNSMLAASVDMLYKQLQDKIKELEELSKNKETTL